MALSSFYNRDRGIELNEDEETNLNNPLIDNNTKPIIDLPKSISIPTDALSSSSFLTKVHRTINYENNRDKDKIYYIGEVYDGQPCGEGKSFYRNGELEYDGHWYCGMKNGKGKLYSKNKALIYDGEFYMNEKQGQGKLYN